MRKRNPRTQESVAINDSQQGVIQLDANGNAATPNSNLASAVPLGIVSPQLGYLQFVAAPWIGMASGLLSLLSGPDVGIASLFAEPSGNLQGQRRDAQLDFELIWCAQGSCSNLNDQDVNFFFRSVNLPHPVTNLSDAPAGVIRNAALVAFKGAFAAYPSVTVGTGGRGTNAVFVVGDNPTLDPQTNKVACAQTPAPVPFFRTAFSRVSYESNMSQAQFALNFQGLTPTQVVLEAIARGIGNNAGREVGHQLRISGMDGDSTDTYNGGSCDGEKAP